MLFCAVVAINVSRSAAYLTIGVVFFGVLWSLFGVRERDCDVTLGTTAALRGVLGSFNAVGGSIGFGIADLAQYG